MILTVIDLGPVIRIKPSRGTLRILYVRAKDLFTRCGWWLDDLEFAKWLLGLCVLAAALSVRRWMKDLALRSTRLFRTRLPGP